ncbi:MAG: choice-of-anchor D domain-containing protein [Burkholderiales bacterium]|jgi:hypothetical protein|nr:choice-of-anchor D domain-containing protein [Burkholderiales bacterium]
MPTEKPLLPTWLRALLALVIGATLSLSVCAQLPPSEWSSTSAGWATPDSTCSSCHGPSGLNLSSMSSIGTLPASSLSDFLTWFHDNNLPAQNGTMSSFYSSSSATSVPHAHIWQYLVDVRDGSIAGPTSGTVDFGDVIAGATAPSQTVTITNYRLINATFGAKSYSNGDFSGGSGLCTLLSPQHACTFNVAYVANGTGADGSGNVNATLTVGQIAGSGTSSDPAGANPLVLNLKAHIVPATRVAMLSTTLLTFSSIVGVPSQIATATLTNTGNSPLTLQQPVIQAPPSGVSGASDYAFASGNNCVAGVLAPGSGCTIKLQFTPSATGQRNAVLAITSDGTGSPSTISLQGTGTPVPVGHLVVDTPSVTMPDTVLGHTSTITINVINTGSAVATLAGLPLSGANAGDFSLAGTCGALTALAINQGCQITLTFAPSGLGPRAAWLTLQSDADDPALSIPLGGKGLAVPAPVASLSTSQLDFGAQTVGGLYPARSIVLSNTGNAPLDIASLHVSGDGYTIVDANACPASLAAGSACTIGVTFMPTTAGASYAGALTVASNASTTPDHVTLQGTGTATAVPVLAWAPAVQTLDFGSVMAGTASTPQSITLVNQGPGGAILQLVNTVGSDAAAFSITVVDCQVGQTVYQGQTCSFNVSFAPGMAGARKAAVQIATTGSIGAAVTLAGTGLGGANLSLSLSASALDFGAIQAGTRSQPHVLHLSNSGPAPLQVSAISTTGPFTAQSATCPPTPFTLPPGAECTVSVTFAPTDSTATTGTLQVQSAAQPQPTTVALAGQGDAAPDLSSGGCSVSRGDGRFDPLLGFLAVLALAALAWRGRQRRFDARQRSEAA